jgi:hypothetical protein
MNFWKHLRWGSVALFLCLLLFAWLANDPSTAGGNSSADPPPVPKIP